MQVVNKRLFKARNNAELLEMFRDILKEENDKLEKEAGYKLSEELIDLYLERIKKYLAYGTDIKPGVGFSCHPETFLEELFWTAVIEKEKIVKVKVLWEKYESKPFFEVLEELSEYEFSEEPINVKELIEEIIEPGRPLIPSIFRESAKELPVSADWNYEDLSILADLIDKGIYIFKTSVEGITMEMLKEE
jgi:hypothetical protein